VIGTNKKDAADTVARIVEDCEAGRLPDAPLAAPDRTAEWLRERAPTVVEWDGWAAIDEHERRLGEPAGRPRVKLVDLKALLDASGATAQRR
jgi:ferredoxin--NADP+ reductase